MEPLVTKNLNFVYMLYKHITFAAIFENIHKCYLCRGRKYYNCRIILPSVVDNGNMVLSVQQACNPSKVEPADIVIMVYRYIYILSRHSTFIFYATCKVKIKWRCPTNAAMINNITVDTENFHQLGDNDNMQFLSF